MRKLKNLQEFVQQLWNIITKICVPPVKKGRMSRKKVEVSLVHTKGKIHQFLGEFALLPADEFAADEFAVDGFAKVSTRLYCVNSSKNICNSDFFGNIGNILKKMAILFLNYGLIYVNDYLNADFNFNVDVVMKELLTTKSDGMSLVDILYEKKEEMLKLPANEVKTIQNHLVEIDIKQFTHNEAYSAKLLSLPVFRTVNDEIISLDKCFAYIVPEGIPLTNVDSLQQTLKVVFLKYSEDKKWMEILLSIKCKPLSLQQLYNDYLFLHWELLDAADRQRHLFFLFKSFQELLLKNSVTKFEETADAAVSKTDEQAMLESLRICSLFGPCREKECSSTGMCSVGTKLHRADEYYSSKEKVFQVMRGEMIIPDLSFEDEETFKPEEWFIFMKTLGMTTKLTAKLCLLFANEISVAAANQSHQGIEQIELKQLSRNSKEVLKGFIALKGDEVCLEDHVKLSEINFICPLSLSGNKTTMHKPYGEGRFIHLRDPYCNSVADFLWTTEPLVSGTVIKLLKCPEDFGILKDAPIDSVIKHLLNLCQMSSLQSSVNKEYQSEIFIKIFNYLAYQSDQKVISSSLQGEACILVEDGQKCVVPKNVVYSLSYNLEPYIYHLPSHFKNSLSIKEMLINSGVTEKVSVEQLVFVLQSLREKAGSHRLSPNNMKLALIAVKSIMEKLSKNDTTESDFYLLTEKGTLLEGSKLIFNNVPAYYQRTKAAGLDLQFMVDSQELEMRSLLVFQALQKLEKRPKFLTECVVDEITDDSLKSQVEQHDDAQKLQEKIRSKLFIDAVLRLIHHENNLINVDVLNNAVLPLQSVEVLVLEKIKTKLIDRSTGQVCGETQQEHNCFAFKKDDSVWQICIIRQYFHSNNMLISVSHHLNHIVQLTARCSALHLPLLLDSQPEQYQSLLDSYHILELRLTKDCSTLLPILGTTVSSADLTFLKPAETVNLRKEDYVAVSRGGQKTCRKIISIPALDRRSYRVLLTEEVDVDINDVEAL